MREFPTRLSTRESTAVVLFIVGVYYLFLMGGLDTLLRSLVHLEDPQVVWKSEGGLWDHPEPNYKVLSFVAEFFASITAIPLAGGFLLYQALRFSYNTPALLLYLMDCWMYTCAFFAHMLLWPVLNSVTLTSVLTNALYTLGIYSGIVGGIFKTMWVRVVLTLSMWAAIVYMVIVLPPWFGENGGVPALLTIQTPAVILALAGARYCRKQHITSPKNKTLSLAFKFLSLSGILLCSAMGVSLVEVLYGKEFQVTYFGIVPVFHIIIHVLEQIGIYLYGVGVAAIEHTLVRPPSHGARGRIEYIGIVPYFAMTIETEQDTATSSSVQSMTPGVRRRSVRSPSPVVTVRRSARLSLVSK